MTPDWARVSHGSTVYQSAYPSPDATAPDTTASITPEAPFTSGTRPNSANTTDRPTARGTPRRKLPAVSATGCDDLRPRNE